MCIPGWIFGLLMLVACSLMKLQFSGGQAVVASWPVALDTSLAVVPTCIGWLHACVDLCSCYLWGMFADATTALMGNALVIGIIIGVTFLCSRYSLGTWQTWMGHALSASSSLRSSCIRSEL